MKHRIVGSEGEAVLRKAFISKLTVCSEVAATFLLNTDKGSMFCLQQGTSVTSILVRIARHIKA